MVKMIDSIGEAYMNIGIGSDIEGKVNVLGNKVDRLEDIMNNKQYDLCVGWVNKKN